MKEINLSNSPLKALVDDEDFEILNQFLWHKMVVRKGELIYAKRTTHIKGKPMGMFMHHFAMQCFGSKVDHKDGNGLNNQKSNLRFCSDSQNQANQKLRKDNSTGFKGVTLCRQTKRFRVKVGKVWVGRFPTKEAAANAYDEAAIRIFGQFAKTNKMLNNTPQT
jgi:hypothetical protein